MPAIGVGVLTQLVNPFVADLRFAATVAALGVLALVTGIRHAPRAQPI